MRLRGIPSGHAKSESRHGGDATRKCRTWRRISHLSRPCVPPKYNKGETDFEDDLFMQTHCFATFFRGAESVATSAPKAGELRQFAGIQVRDSPEGHPVR